MTDGKRRVRLALERVETEREHVTEELAAYDRFDATVREVDPVTPGDFGTRTAADGGTVRRVETTVGDSPSTTDEAGRVREAFAETVRPHSVADIEEPEPLAETMAAELGTEISAALSSRTPGQFTPEVKGAVRSAVERRRAELRATMTALEVETGSLTGASDTFDEVVDWLVSADERPLSELGFEGLRRRHETLASFRSRCSSVTADRQEVLRRTTSHGPNAGVPHESLVAYLYQELSTDHPVLTTAARLESLCAGCQRTVRDHLVGRV